MIYHTYSEIDRAIYEAIRLTCVAEGYTPDVLVDNTAALWETAMQNIKAGGKQPIEIRGVGTWKAKGELKQNYIVIERTNQDLSAIGYKGQTCYQDNGDSTFSYEKLPTGTFQLTYEITLAPLDTTSERVMKNIMLKALDSIKELSGRNEDGTETENKFLLFWQANVDLSDEDYSEYVMTYQTSEVFLQENEVIEPNLAALTEATLELPGDDIYAIKFDGVNDYLKVDEIATPFSEFERTQPWTFYINLEIFEANARTRFFDTRVDGGNMRGVFVGIEMGNIRLTLNSNVQVGNNRMIVDSLETVSNGKHTIQVVYKGDSNPNTVEIYYDGVLLTNDVNQNNLGGTIVNGLNEFFVNEDTNSPNTNNQEMKIRWLSFVNYAKSQSEIESDHGAGIQMEGLGQFLLAVDFNRQNQQTLTFNSKDVNAYKLDILGQIAPPNFEKF